MKVISSWFRQGIGGAKLVHVGCGAHARRKFVDAVKVNPKDEHAVKIVVGGEIHEACLAIFREVLPKSTLGQAAQYTLNEWTKLKRCLDYAEEELSNNLAENSMRPVALEAEELAVCRQREVGTEGGGDTFGGGIVPAVGCVR